MEGIIIFIVMMVLGSLFKGKKETEDDGSKTKPFMPQQSQPQQRKQASQTPLKKLREASEEMMRELQQSMNEEQGQQQRKPVEQRRPQQPLPSQNPYVKREEEPVSAQIVPQEPVKPTRAIRKKKEEVKQTVNETNLIPKDGEDLIRGVIFSEIFGPPKSKR